MCPLRAVQRLALVVGFLWAGAGAAHADDLRSVVERTLQTNPEIQALMSNRRAIEEELEAAKGLGRAKLDVSGKAGYLRQEDDKEGALDDFDDDTTQGSVSGMIALPVFDGWKTYYEVERQGNRVDSARHRVADTANSLAIQAIQAYLEVQRAGSVLELAEDNHSAHRKILSRVQARVSGGKSPEAELVQARARLASSEAAVVEAKARFIDAQSLFLSVVGEMPGQLSAARAPTGALPATVDEAVSVAIENAPSLVALRHDALAAGAAIGTAEAEFYPKIGLEISATHESSEDGDFGLSNDFSAMLTIKKNLYNGGIDTARVREAQHRRDQAERTAENAGRLIEKEVRLSWLAIISARQRSEAIGHQLNENRQLVEAYTRQFDLGQRSLLDILDIQNEIFVNETTLATERFSGTFNSYRVLAAMGTLVAALDIPLPEEATLEPDTSRSWIALP